MKINKFILLILSILVISCGDEDEIKAKMNYYKLNITISPDDMGNVEVFDATTNLKIVQLDSISEGTKVKIIPAAKDGYEFSGFWESGVYVEEENPVFTILRDYNVNVVFRMIGGTPAEVFGHLSVDGSSIVDANQNPVQLKGMSLFWSQWMGQYWNANVVNWLVMDWEANVIRAAMGVDENGGYIFNATEKQKVETIVEAAIDMGVYVIIDWHSHHAENYTEQAVGFFSEMAKKYGSYPNVIYEIYNEPLNVSWSSTIKPYAERVISAIRAEDPDNIILVGTPKWSQDVDAVIGNTIEGNNIAYVFHFYASEPDHHNRLFDKATTAISAGIPLFVTEWGVSEASGTGNFNQVWTKEWLDFMDLHKLSWCNWSVADKAETSAALMPGANAQGSWSNAELSPSGIYIREVLRKHQGYTNPR